MECKKESSWIKHFWRPAIAWQYVIVCLFDFFLAPTALIIFSFYTGIPFTGWEPITLKESAFYHLAMGAILGVAAYTRGQEKIKNILMRDDTEEVKG